MRLTGGKYYIGDGGSGDQGVKIGNNTHLLLDQDAVIIRKFHGSGTEEAVIGNRCQETGDCEDDVIGNQHIRVSGGSMDNEEGYSGHHLGFIEVGFLNISDMQFLGIVHWNVSLRNCNDVVVSNLLMDSGTETNSAGIQISGGSRYVIADCDIRCGDDSIALVVDTFQAGDIRDVVVSNCYLHSREANALKILVEENVTFTIGRVQISNIVAKVGQPDSGSSQGIIIADQNYLKRVFDVEIDGFWLDASQGYGDVLWIDGAKRLRLSRVVLDKPVQRARIAGSDDVALIDCTIDLNSNAASVQQCLIVGQPLPDPPNPTPDGTCRNFRIVGGEYLNAKTDAIIMGVDSPVIGFEISHARITGAGNNGVFIYNATKGTVIGNRISECGGWGIQETGTSNENLILGNWLKTNTAGTISFAGSQTQVVRNWAPANVAVPDSGGHRQTIDGWTTPAIPNGTSMGLTEMTRANGRFRAVRPGSVTGIVVTLSEVRQGGSMTVLVYKNTGNADAPSPGTNTLVGVVINTNVNRKEFTVPIDSSAASRFAAGDELYLMITTASWTVGPAAPGPTKVFCAFDVEN